MQYGPSTHSSSRVPEASSYHSGNQPVPSIAGPCVPIPLAALAAAGAAKASAVAAATPSALIARTRDRPRPARAPLTERHPLPSVAWTRSDHHATAECQPGVLVHVHPARSRSVFRHAAAGSAFDRQRATPSPALGRGGRRMLRRCAAGRLRADADNLARRRAEAVLGRAGPDLDDEALRAAQRARRLRRADRDLGLLAALDLLERGREDLVRRGQDAHPQERRALRD